jgi:anti-anti-sigma factor
MSLIGELDMASTAELRACADRLIGTGARHLHFDLARLTFCDAAGLGALIHARNSVRDHRGDLTLSHVQGIPRRLLSVCGLLDLFTGAADSSVSVQDDGA